METNPNEAPLEDDSMLRELAEGAVKVFQNAVDLHDEASRLHTTGAFSRALFLHQISLEECAKIEMLGAWAVSVLTGLKTDLRRLTIEFASHKAKNYTNAYLLPATNTELDARRAKRWHDAMGAFKQQQAEFHAESNSAKNASLYVDLQDGTFTAPKDQITEPMVRKIAEANEYFLSGAHSKVGMMTRWVDNPERARALLAWFENRLTELTSQSDDPQKAMSAIMDELLARAAETGYRETMTKDKQVGTDHDGTHK